LNVCSWGKGETGRKEEKKIARGVKGRGRGETNNSINISKQRGIISNYRVYEGEILQVGGKQTHLTIESRLVFLEKTGESSTLEEGNRPDQKHIREGKGLLTYKRGRGRK